MLEWNEVRIDQEMGDWTVDMYFVAENIQGGPTKVVVRPTDPERVPVGGISSTVLRRINFREGAKKAREKEKEECLDHIRELEAAMPPQVSMPLLQATLEASGVTDVYLVLLATEYIARVARGEDKPVDHIASELGRSLGTVKNHLWQARSRGLLLGGSAGRKGGHVPPDAAQIALDYLDEIAAATGDSAGSEDRP